QRRVHARLREIRSAADRRRLAEGPIDKRELAADVDRAAGPEVRRPLRVAVEQLEVRPEGAVAHLVGAAERVPEEQALGRRRRLSGGARTDERRGSEPDE